MGNGESGAGPITIGRRENRTFAVQCLYSYDISPLIRWEEHWAGQLEALDLPERSLSYARQLVEGTVANLFEINGLLAKFLDNWSLDRVQRVSLAILRVAVYELLYGKNIPKAVVINEAIELTKLYGGPDSKRIVNGLLDRIRRHLEEQAVEKSETPSSE
ncbi:MAG: transcription antitermination factor NusB [Puniceicoccales bacterium]|jgi:N utilization substance protein B|nr:transcription antitermination factor NusB [Puniceicoccales bacterium]